MKQQYAPLLNSENKNKGRWEGRDPVQLKSRHITKLLQFAKNGIDMDRQTNV